MIGYILLGICIVAALLFWACAAKSGQCAEDERRRGINQ